MDQYFFLSTQLWFYCVVRCLVDNNLVMIKFAGKHETTFLSTPITICKNDSINSDCLNKNLLNTLTWWLAYFYQRPGAARTKLCLVFILKIIIIKHMSSTDCQPKKAWGVEKDDQKSWCNKNTTVFHLK